MPKRAQILRSVAGGGGDNRLQAALGWLAVSTACLNAGDAETLNQQGPFPPPETVQSRPAPPFEIRPRSGPRVLGKSIIIQPRDSKPETSDAVQRLHQENRISDVRELVHLRRLQVVKVPARTDAPSWDELISHYANSGAVAFASPDFCYFPDQAVVPNDPWFSNTAHADAPWFDDPQYTCDTFQWGLNNADNTLTEYFNGSLYVTAPTTATADINAPEAW